MGVLPRQRLLRRIRRGCYFGLDLIGFRSCAPRAHNDAYLFGWTKFLPHVNGAASQINRNVFMGHRDAAFGGCGGALSAAR
jgi:hypothetical protein